MAGRRKTKKRKSTGSYPGTKADFIRSQPGTMSAQQIVDKAKAQGIELSRAHVYVVKSTAKKGRKKRSNAPQRRPARAPSAAAARTRANTSAEARLRQAIADIGLVRASEILDSVRSSIMGR